MRLALVVGALLFGTSAALAQTPSPPPTPATAAAAQEWSALMTADQMLQVEVEHTKTALQALINENATLQAQVKELQAGAAATSTPTPTPTPSAPAPMTPSQPGKP